MRGKGKELEIGERTSLIIVFGNPPGSWDVRFFLARVGMSSVKLPADNGQWEEVLGVVTRY